MAARTQANGDRQLRKNCLYRDDMKAGYTANLHNEGSRRDGDSRRGRLGEFGLLARVRVSNRFDKENIHVAQ